MIAAAVAVVVITVAALIYAACRVAGEADERAGRAAEAWEEKLAELRAYEEARADERCKEVG